MTDSTIFKKLAAEKLSAALFQQVETNLDLLLECFNETREYEYYSQQSQYEYLRDLENRYRQIRSEFEATFEPMWPGFARERWPEIDEHFKLKLAKDKNSTDSDIPF